jgi:hypothetical protein
MTFSDNWLRGVNAPHKHQLGWLGEAGARLVTDNGLYGRFAALAKDPNATTLPKTLVIAKNDTGTAITSRFAMTVTSLNGPLIRPTPVV